MDVEDRLPCIAMGVENGPVPPLMVAVVFREPCREAAHGSDERVLVLGQVVQRGDMRARHDQQVKGGLWIDVAEGHQGVVLVHDGRRNFASNDLAKETAHRRSMIAVRGIPCRSCRTRSSRREDLAWTRAVMPSSWP